MSKIFISKLDAASRQLQMAVRLFVAGGDPVSIHTLASAAQEIFEKLAEEQGIKSQRLQTLESVKAEYREKVRKSLNQAKNFFKHADRDPKNNLTFNPDSNEFVIWDAERLYYSLTKEKIGLFSVFDLWIIAKYPDMFNLSDEQERGYKILFKGLDTENRGKFFSDLLLLDRDSFNNAIKG